MQQRVAGVGLGAQDFDSVLIHKCPCIEIPILVYTDASIHAGVYARMYDFVDPDVPRSSICLFGSCHAAWLTRPNTVLASIYAAVMYDRGGSP